MDIPVRTELEYMYHTPIEYEYTNSSNSTSFKNEITIQTVFVNAAWDWHNNTDFIPYITAGAGVAIIDEDYSSTGMDLSSSSDTTTNFAYNVGAGVAWKMTDSWLLDLSYRYEDYGDTSDSVTGSSQNLSETFDKVKDLRSHNAILGIRYQF